MTASILAITRIFKAPRREPVSPAYVRAASDITGFRTLIIREAPLFIETWQVPCWCPRHRS